MIARLALIRSPVRFRDDASEQKNQILFAAFVARGGDQ